MPNKHASYRCLSVFSLYEIHPFSEVAGDNFLWRVIVFSFIAKFAIHLIYDMSFIQRIPVTKVIMLDKDRRMTRTRVGKSKPLTGFLLWTRSRATSLVSKT